MSELIEHLEREIEAGVQCLKERPDDEVLKHAHHTMSWILQEVHKLESSCIPLPTLPDEMEDGQTLFENDYVKVSLYISGDAKYPPMPDLYCNYKNELGDFKSGDYVSPSFLTLFGYPSLYEDYEVQGNKIRRKG